MGQCALARRLDGPFASLMEKIMSKTSNATRERELTEVELDAVAGGNIAWAIVIGGAIADSLTDGAFSRPIDFSKWL